MAKKAFTNPAEALLARDPEAVAPETASEAQAEEAVKTERLTFLCNANVLKDLNDLVVWRTVKGEKVAGAIRGTRARKPSASLILNEALREYMAKDSVQAELAEYRSKF